MVKRITEKPFRIKASIVEGTVNVFTTEKLNFPIAPVIGGDRMQGIELMRVKSRIQRVQAEAAQTNNVNIQLTKSLQTALLNYADDNIIFTRNVEAQGLAANGISIYETDLDESMTDDDGNGIVLTDRTVHFSIKGSGNAAAASGGIDLFVHLVELDPGDAVIQLLSQDD